MKSVDAKRVRSNHANQLIVAIATRGRQFFFHKGVPSEFDVDDRGRVWFTDAYSKRRIYLHYKHWSRGFSEGGTLHALVRALTDYIRTGEPMRGHLGPWRPSICGGDLWGYGFDWMQEIRDIAEQLGITDKAARAAGGTP